MLIPNLPLEIKEFLVDMPSPGDGYGHSMHKNMQDRLDKSGLGLGLRLKHANINTCTIPVYSLGCTVYANIKHDYVHISKMVCL